VKIKEYEPKECLEIKIHVLFHGYISWTVAHGQIKFGRVKDHGRAYKFYFNHYFDEAFKYREGAKF
jgi:hypothetical protein